VLAVGPQPDSMATSMEGEIITLASQNGSPPGL
jgi:hypothetical protein